MNDFYPSVSDVCEDGDSLSPHDSPSTDSSSSRSSSTGSCTSQTFAAGQPILSTPQQQNSHAMPGATAASKAHLTPIAAATRGAEEPRADSPEVPVCVHITSITARLSKVFASFDGSKDSLRSIPVLPEAEDSVPTPPEGTEVFPMVWFGVAQTMAAYCIRQDSPARQVVADLHPLPISLRNARTLFVGALIYSLEDVTRGHGFRRSFPYLAALETISNQLMEAWLAEIPPTVREQFPTLDTLVDSVDTLEAVFLMDFDHWMMSFYPLYQHVCRTSSELLMPLCSDPGIEQVDMEEVRFLIASLCAQRNLQTNAKGEVRGVLVPLTWVQQLVLWLKGSGECSRLPKPIDSFGCVEVPTGQLGQHWLLPAARTAVDVIPERLFDLFSSLFGSGPKYMLFGFFTSRTALEEAVCSTPLRVEVCFAKMQGIDTAKTTVYVEDAIHRTDLAELCRMGLSLAVAEEGTLTPEDEELWSAAILSGSSVRFIAKELRDVPMPTPLEVSTDLRETTIGVVIRQMKERLRGSLPQVVGGWEELRVEVLLEPEEESVTNPLLLGQMAARRGVCGLTNVGNTCYMNSALQCLSNLRSFRNHLLSLPVSRYPHSVITGALVDLLAKMWSGKYEYADTRQLKEIIGHKVKRFAGHYQQDANEFIEVLLDRIEEEVNLVSGRRYRERLDTDKGIPLVELSNIFWENFLANNTGFIPEEFFHQSKTIFTCQTCGECSTVFDNNLTLSLNIAVKPVVSMRTMRAAVTIDVLPTVIASPLTFSSPHVRGPSCDYDPKDRLVHAYILVDVPSSEETIARHDLEDAIRSAVAGNADITSLVRQSIFAPTSLDVMTSPQYEVRVLEVPHMPDRVTYAWVQCSFIHPSVGSTTTSETPPLPAVSSGYRVWYFMTAMCDNPKIDHTALLVDVQEVGTAEECNNAISSTLSSSEGCSSLTSDAPTHYDDIVQAPLSRQIIMRGKSLSQHLLEPASPQWTGDDMEGTVEGVLTDCAATAPAPSRAEENVKSVDIRVLHGSNRRHQLPLDVSHAAATAGDAWLEERRRQQRGSVTWPGVDNDESTDVAACEHTDVVIFLAYPKESNRCIALPTVGNEHFLGFRDFASRPSMLDNSCTLDECLTRSSQSDIITDSDSWYCPSCKEFRETRVQRSVFRLPQCLLISFKRFKLANSYHAEKNNALVLFPVDLNMAPFIDPEAAPCNPVTQYKLRGVVYHSGSLSFGHYTASAYCDTLKKWVYFNDAHATPKESASPAPDGAYIICYEREGGTVDGAEDKI